VDVRTDDLIDKLADDLRPVQARLIERQLAKVTFVGGAIVLALIAGLTGLRSDLSSAINDFDFWAKLVYTASIAGIALAGARHLARPEAKAMPLKIFAVPVVILIILAAVELGSASAQQRATLIFGSTWQQCPVLITLFSLPLLGAMLHLFSHFAPSRLRFTGAIIGLACGATTAMLYTLHCPESAMTFLLLWYSAGIATIGAIGAVAGPFVLRW
jgi:hypothetical protein